MRHGASAGVSPDPTGSASSQPNPVHSPTLYPVVTADGCCTSGAGVRVPRLGQPTPSATTQPPRPLLARGCAPKPLQENSFASTPALPTHRLPRARCATPPLLRRTPRRQCRLEQVTTHRLPEPHRHTSVATPPRRGSTARQPPMRRPRAELTVQALEVDHVVQCYLGGSGEPGNLRLVCPACHRERTQAQAQAARRWTFSLT